MQAALADHRLTLRLRQELLIEANLHSLRQALTLLELMNDSAYRDAPTSLPNHKIGAHFRHILEFYECFLDGMETDYIDYDARRRDHVLQTSRTEAMARIRAIMLRLENSPALLSDHVVWVRMEDSAIGGIDPCLTSSPGRELQVLASHTIHHFALIAITLTAHGLEAPPDFGMAPSTLRYLSNQSARAAATEAA